MITIRDELCRSGGSGVKGDGSADESDWVLFGAGIGLQPQEP